MNTSGAGALPADSGEGLGSAIYRPRTHLKVKEKPPIDHDLGAFIILCLRLGRKPDEVRS
jgi:hypothetical protein